MPPRNSDAGAWGRFLPDDLRRIVDETFVRHIDYFPRLESTNDHAIQLAADLSLPIPLLVLAAQQTAGRGRGTRRWWSGEGALTFSLVVDSDRDSRSSRCDPRISPAVACAVHDALAPFVPRGQAGLKWPNDVFLEGRKVCGILVESPASAPGRIVVGVGLNVNNPLADAPADVRDTATSLRDATGVCRPLAGVLTAVLQQMATQIEVLKQPEYSLAERWAPLCLLRRRRVCVETPTQRTEGICQGIDNDGALLVETDRGVHRCFSGHVREVGA